MDDIFSTEADDVTAHQRLRAFEDRHLGEDAVRINGAIERGHGSLFAIKMTEAPELRRQHAAIERLIEAEKKLGEAEGTLSVAQSEHATAKAAVDEATKATEAAKPAPALAAAKPLEPAHTDNL
jgi:hypothetical protein